MNLVVEEIRSQHMFQGIEHLISLPYLSENVNETHHLRSLLCFGEAL